jgi:rubrerythrin
LLGDNSYRNLGLAVQPPKEFVFMKRSFDSLEPQEALQVAISIEERNAELYERFAERFNDLGTEESGEIAVVFWEMASEERGHQALLKRKYKEYYGQSSCALTHNDLVELIEMPKVDECDLFDRKDGIQPQCFALQVALQAEISAQNYYANLVEQTSEESLRKTYRDLTEIETDHARYLSVKLGLDTPLRKIDLLSLESTNGNSETSSPEEG